MFVIGNLFDALALVVHYVLTLYMWIIIAKAVLSWVSPDPYNPIVRVINGVTEPVLDRVRRLIPTQMGGVDFSPIIVILCILFLQRFLVATLYRMGRTMM